MGLGLNKKNLLIGTLLYSIICKHFFFKYKILVMDYAGSCNESAEPVNSSFRGNPYLITRLYSLKYTVTCVVHVSRA